MVRNRSLDPRTGPRGVVLLLAIGSVALSALGACSAPEARRQQSSRLQEILLSLPIEDLDRAWIGPALGDRQGDRLISIHTDIEWNSTEVRDRYVDRDRLTCIVHRRLAGTHASTVAYALRDKNAIQMFRHLHNQAAMGYRFREPNYEETTTNPSASFLIAVGERCGVTADEGGVAPTQRAVSEVERWRVALATEEPIRDGDLAVAYMDGSAFASIATYVVMAVAYFDDLCEIADRHKVPAADRSGE